MTVPEMTGGLPYFGHALPFRRDPVTLLQKGRARHGDIFRFGLFGKRVYALLSPEGNSAFFRASDDQLSAREAYRFTVPIFGPGVAYDVAPEIMDQQLRLLHPGLRDEAMQAYCRYMAEEVERFADSLGDQGEIDLLAAFSTLTTYIAGRCLVGAAFRRRLSAEFAALYHDLEGGINLIAFMAPNFPSPANRRRDRARRRMVGLISDIMASRRRDAEQDDDFLSVLMAARYEDGRPLSDDVIAGLLLTLLFAGQHTSAVMAAWVGILLMQNPDELARVRDETASVVGDRPILLADLKRLHRLEYCLKEAERLHPPLVMLMRTVLRELKVGRAVLPPGSLALVSPGVSHRLPNVFAHPDRFDPDRFAPPREEDRATPYSLIGFGGGKHRCLGLAFAHQQVKVIWCLLLKRFDFKLVDAEAIPDYTTFVVGPRPPCRMRYWRRRSTSAGGRA